MNGPRLRAIVRVREAVPASSEPQLERGQDDEDTLALRRKAKKAKKRRKLNAVPARESGHVRFVVELREAAVTKTGNAYEVTLVREGPGNPSDRNAYTKEALRKAVSDGLFEGLQAYADHPTASEERDRPERSVRHLVGHFREGRYVDGNPAEVRAKFIPVTGPGYEWVTTLVESALHSVPDRPLIGISIDGQGYAPDQQQINGRTYNMVREVTHLGSADIVTRAGAGGRFIRRLSESVHGLGGLVADPPALTAAKLQKRVTRGLALLESAFETEDEDQVAGAVLALREAASATIKAKQPQRHPEEPPGLTPDGSAEELERLRAKLAKQKRRRRRAEAAADLANRARHASAMLREAGVSGPTAEAWHQELVEQPNKAAMQERIDRLQARRRDEMAELRESFGVGTVEGAGRREAAPSGPARGSLLTLAGIDSEDIR